MQTIKVKEEVDLPNGVYKCNVNNDIAKVVVGSELLKIELEKDIEELNVSGFMTVKDRVATVKCK